MRPGFGQAAFFFVLDSPRGVCRVGPSCLSENFLQFIDLPPLNQGGAVARAGFLYQDHVGARFCIEMLRTRSSRECGVRPSMTSR